MSVQISLIAKIANCLNIIIVFILLQCVADVSSIKCFVCDSSINPGCADLKTNSSIVAEECTVEKMKSIHTWLFDLNKFEYFDMKLPPLMHCQKVVTQYPNSIKLLTARFCQLDTGDTDACFILRNRLEKYERPQFQSGNNYNSNNNNNNAGRQGHNVASGSSIITEKFHCSVCNSDRCNGASSQRLNVTLLEAFIISLLLHLVRQAC